MSFNQNLQQINAIEEQLVREKKQEIERSFEFNLVILGGHGVGKTSFFRKITGSLDVSTSILRLFSWLSPMGNGLLLR